MKRQIFGRLVALLVTVVAVCACATACGEVPPTEQTTVSATDANTTTSVTETTTEAPSDAVMLIGEDGKARYRIVRPENGTDSEIKAGIELNQALKALTGVSFTLTTDFLMPKDDPEVLPTTYEILVGNTTRQESEKTAEGLAANEYVISVTDYKIILAGGSDAAIYVAMEAFLTMVEKGELLVSKQDGNYVLTKGSIHKAEMENSGYLVALTNQGQSVLEVYDVSTGRLDDSTRVWSYKTPYNNIAGTKLRHSDIHGDVALIVCGSNHGYMVSYPEGKLLWSTSSAAANPHSIELMPNGIIAIASSNGNEVRFFTTEKNYSASPAAAAVLPDAHGVLWDQENGVLWAVGRAVLTAYKVELSADGKVSVTEDTSRRFTIPSDHAHDLAPVYGDTNGLWITTGSNVYRFDKTTGKFSTDYPGASSVNRANVKGVGNFADGSMVYIYPDGKYYSWTSRSMVLVRNQGGDMIEEKLISEQGHFYKVRVWDKAYQ